jgi:hypothetical protein
MHIRNRHTQKTRSEKVEGKREHMLIRIIISNKTPQTINEIKEPLGLPPWNGQWKNHFATGGLNLVLGCTNITLAPTGSHISKQ